MKKGSDLCRAICRTDCGPRGTAWGRSAGGLTLHAFEGPIAPDVARVRNRKKRDVEMQRRLATCPRHNLARSADQGLVVNVGDRRDVLGHGGPSGWSSVTGTQHRAGLRDARLPAGGRPNG